MTNRDIENAIVNYLRDAITVPGVSISIDYFNSEPEAVIAESGHIFVAYSNDINSVYKGYIVENKKRIGDFEINGQYIITITNTSISNPEDSLFELKEQVIDNLSQLIINECKPISYIGSSKLKSNGENVYWMQLSFNVTRQYSIPEHITTIQ